MSKLREDVDHAEIMNRCDDKAQHDGWDSLSNIERTFVIVSRTNFEIELGGFSSFYYNTAGDFADESVIALNTVGAKSCARVVKTANDCFPGGVSKDRNVRYEMMRNMSEDRLSQFDSQFNSDDDAFTCLCIFIEQHLPELTEHIQS